MRWGLLAWNLNCLQKSKINFLDLNEFKNKLTWRVNKLQISSFLSCHYNLKRILIKINVAINLFVFLEILENLFMGLSKN